MLASTVMSSLDNIWNDKRLSLSTKLRVYLTLVQFVLLYTSETWTLTVADSKRTVSHLWITPRYSYGVSLAIWDRTVLPST